jgi:hypothetical protein
MTFFARFFTLKSLTKNSPPVSFYLCRSSATKNIFRLSTKFLQQNKITNVVAFNCSLFSFSPLQLIAAAALVLAGKCNDEPRRLMNLTVEIMKQWYGRQNPDLRSKFSNQDYLDGLLALVEEAELVLMFTLKFDFNVDPLVVEAIYKIKETDCLASALKLASFQQFLVSSSNDIMRRDAGMVLQYRGEDIALAICQLFFKVSKQRGMAAAAALEPPADSATGVAWYVNYGLTEEIHRQISGRFHKLYANVQKNEGSVDGMAATTAADSGGLTEGEALGIGRGGDGGGGGAAARSVGGSDDAGISTIPAYVSTTSPEYQTQQLQKVTTLDSKPQKLKPAAGTSGGGGGRRMISISMDRTTTTSVSHAPTKPPPGKRPCSWADEPVIPQPIAGTAGWGGGGSGATPPAGTMSRGGIISSSSQQQQQQQQQPSKSVYTNYAPPYSNREPAAAAGGGVRGGGEPGPQFPAPAPAEDSEPEEGELEEGEIR